MIATIILRMLRGTDAYKHEFEIATQLAHHAGRNEGIYAGRKQLAEQVGEPRPSATIHSMSRIRENHGQCRLCKPLGGAP